MRTELVEDEALRKFVRLLAIRLLLAMWRWEFWAFVALVAFIGWLSGYDVR